MNHQVPPKKVESHMVTFLQGKANTKHIAPFLLLFSSERKKEKRPFAKNTSGLSKRIRVSYGDRKSWLAIFHNPRRGLIIARRKATKEREREREEERKGEK